MPPSDNDGEADVEGFNFADDMKRQREKTARLDVFMASDEYRLACHAAVQANKLEFALDDGKSGGTFDSDSMGNDSSGDDGDDSSDDGDDSSTFDQYTVSATVCPDGDMPRGRIATLRMTAIAESRVNPEIFEDDIMNTCLEAEELTDSLSGPDGTFKSDTWGRGSPYEGTGVWHSEFGQDLLVYIEEIHVKHPFRGMGIGTKLFNQALDWVGKKARELGLDNNPGSYLVVAPGLLNRDPDREFGEVKWYAGRHGRRQEVAAFAEKLADKSRAFWASSRRSSMPYTCWPDGLASARTHPHTTILKLNGQITG